MSDSKSKSKNQSGLGIFGAFVIAIGLFIAFIKQDAFIAGVCVGVGVFLIILSLFLDRLDTIIDLLSQIVEHQSKDDIEKKDPSDES